MKNPNRTKSIRVVGKENFFLIDRKKEYETLRIIEKDDLIHKEASQLISVRFFEKIFLLGPSINFENIEKSTMLRHAAPLLGEHTRLILQTELGYTNEQFDKLLRDKTIQ